MSLRSHLLLLTLVVLLPLAIFGAAYEVAKRLRLGRGRRSDMLLIALTGYGSQEARRKAKDAGFDEYLVKPVSPRDLAELIELRLDARAGVEPLSPQ
jgi:CheY-like chemotaxis protein